MNQRLVVDVFIDLSGLHDVVQDQSLTQNFQIIDVDELEGGLLVVDVLLDLNFNAGKNKEYKNKQMKKETKQKNITKKKN